MNILIPKVERKAALLSFLGLLALTAIICASELWTHHLHAREHLINVALGATFGAIGGAVFGYIGWLSSAAARYLTGAFLDHIQIVRTVTVPADPEGMRAKLETAGR